MQQKQQNHQTDDDQFLHQRCIKTFNCAFDQVAPVIHGNNLYTVRQAAFQLLKFGAYGLNCRQRIFTEAHDNNTTGNLSFSVQVNNPSAQLRPNMDMRNILQTYWGTIGIHTDRYTIEIIDRFNVTQTSNHVLGFSHFNESAANVLVGHFYRHLNFVQGYVVSQ